jgi:hypothetical protein
MKVILKYLIGSYIRKEELVDNIVKFPGSENIKKDNDTLENKLKSLTYDMDGQLTPLVLSQWLICKGCSVTYKIGTHVPVFIDQVKESWEKAAKENASPIIIIGWKCEHCDYITNVAITDINIKVCAHRIDGSEW